MHHTSQLAVGWVDMLGGLALFTSGIIRIPAVHPWTRPLLRYSRSTCAFGTSCSAVLRGGKVRHRGLTPAFLHTCHHHRYVDVVEQLLLHGGHGLTTSWLTSSVWLSVQRLAATPPTSLPVNWRPCWRSGPSLRVQWTSSPTVGPVWRKLLARWASTGGIHVTLQLCVNISMGHKDVTKLPKIPAKARTIVGHFRWSLLAMTQLERAEQQLDLPRHKLLQDCTTRWNSQDTMHIQTDYTDSPDCLLILLNISDFLTFLVFQFATF